MPIKHPELFKRVENDPPKGILLHGPPGSGKTLLASAIATETDANFIVINGPEIISRYHGQSEKDLRTIFAEAKKKAPSIIFFDHLDSIFSSKYAGKLERRLVAQFSILMFNGNNLTIKKHDKLFSKLLHF